MKTLAIIGSGISGLSAAWFLRKDFDVQLFEADSRLGGHSNTVTVQEEGKAVSIDTGFMVFNRATYPNLIRLFEHLGVHAKATDMSFSVQHRPLSLEYSGSSLNHLFAQRRNLLRPRFLRMLWQVNRFNQEALQALESEDLEHCTLGHYVELRGYGEDFLKLYLIPMSSAVWSTPPSEMLRFPARTLLRFFYNHGFLGLHTQHPWLTLDGGAKSYVDKLASSLEGRLHLNTPVLEVFPNPEGGQCLRTSRGLHQADGVIFACHPPASLRILGDRASAGERDLLSAFRYQPNLTTLHTDSSVLPETALARSSWNYRMDVPRESDRYTGGDEGLEVSTHYWMNRLQGVSQQKNYIVSVNGSALPASSSVLKRIDYEHPLFDLAAISRQSRLPALNREALTDTQRFHIGAWHRYGFHEDGLLSSLELCRLLLKRDPWEAVL